MFMNVMFELAMGLGGSLPTYSLSAVMVSNLGHYKEGIKVLDASKAK